MRILISLMKASGIAALVFALAWIRWPFTVSTLSLTLSCLIGFGIIFAILSLLIGLPFVLIMEKCQIGRRWSYTLVAGTIGALLALAFGHHRSGPMENPHGGLVFSPWTRDTPGIDSFPVSSAEYICSIAFCAIVGGVLGLAFWHFYSRSLRPNQRLERPVKPNSDAP
jgi:hypothetical protein